MTDFSSNDPSSFGWTAPTLIGVVPFSFRGVSFPQGVHPLAVRVLSEALTRLTAVQGFQLHPGPPMTAGCWGYEDRGINGNSGVKSFHAYGIALDLNAPWNAQYDANPPASPYRVPDVADELLRPLGILWGGAPEFGSRPDRMHIEIHRSPSELGGALPPAAGSRAFPLPVGWYYGPASGPTQSVSGAYASDAPYRAGLIAAQRALGTAADGLYGPNTASAARSYQAAHSLVADGLIGALTWASLFR